MLQLIQKGNYKLLETIRETKILSLDGKEKYAWIYAKDIGEILVALHNPHQEDHVLTCGKYRIYKVKNDPKLTDTLHLELYIGEGQWQGYLLPTGFPTVAKTRTRIIPTQEIITKAAFP